MRIVSMAVILVGVFVAGLSSLRARQAAEPRPEPVGAAAQQSADRRNASSVVGTYCAGCHNGLMRSPSGALLDRFDLTQIGEDRETWVRAYRQLQAGTMPPAGAPRPGRPAYDALLMTIEAAIGAQQPAVQASSADVAERLALALWNSAPDAPLLADVKRDRLTDRATVERHVRRMLSDDRARSFITRFFFRWLGLDRLATADPDRMHFPDYDVSLRDAMERETELFLLAQLREDRDPIELWTANYTYLNEQLARHYGIAGVAGAQFGRVTLSSPERRGLLGHGSVLMATSRHQHGTDAGYTSPATRALWVRMRFSGAPAPQPFPGAPPVKPDLPIAPQTRTLPAHPCANCHRNFFPLGYALENFDPIGRWRTHDQAGPVDASGTFVDGTPIDGVAGLRDVLLQRPDAFRTTITEQLIVHASGRSANGSRPAPAAALVDARRILRGMNSVRWSSIIAAVVASRPTPWE